MLPSMSFDSWIAIVGAVAGIIGIIVAIYSFVKTRQITELSYTIQSTELLGSAKSVLPGEVEIIFSGGKIANLNKANYIFWNTGNKPIVRRHDLPEDIPITIQFGDASTLLKASILKISKN
jgi:hypothetical protein